MNDTDKFPLFFYNPESKKIDPIKKDTILNFPGTQWQFHHFIEKKYLKKHPEKREGLIKLQKLILMPADMNYDINSRTLNFKKRWGIALEEVVYTDKET